MAKEASSFRLHPILDDLIENQAKDLNTTKSWIIEAALADYFRDRLMTIAPHFRPGMPHKDSDGKGERH